MLKQQIKRIAKYAQFFNRNTQDANAFHVMIGQKFLFTGYHRP